MIFNIIAVEIKDKGGKTKIKINIENRLEVGLKGMNALYIY